MFFWATANTGNKAWSLTILIQIQINYLNSFLVDIDQVSGIRIGVEIKTKKIARVKVRTGMPLSLVRTSLISLSLLAKKKF